MSPQIEDLVGYTALECMSDPEFFVKILHPDDRERTQAAPRATRPASPSRSRTACSRTTGGQSGCTTRSRLPRMPRVGPCTPRAFSSTSRRRSPRRRRRRQNAELRALHETALLLIDELDHRLLERIAVQAGELGAANTRHLREDDELQVAVGTGCSPMASVSA